MTDDDVKRTERDGQVRVQRIGANRDSICISVDDNQDSTYVVMSDFNARRVLVALAMMLDLPLTKTALKKVRM